MERIHSYPPVYRADARLLILGTAPSVESLKQGFYYAHPRNAFWTLLADVLGAPRPDGVEEKKALLLENRIALWDVARSCVRPGSLDADIRDVLPNDVPGLLERCPRVARVLLNGGTAYALYRRYFRDAISVEALKMPSTSPAYTLSYARKRALWRAAILETLGEDAK